MSQNSHAPKNNAPREELSGLLRSSVDAVLAEPIARDDVAKSLDLARQIETMATLPAMAAPDTPFPTATLPAASSRRPWPWRRTMAIAAAAAALVVVALLVSHNWRSVETAITPVAWADVVKAVAQKPWLHRVSTCPDGSKDEVWFSATRSVLAFHRGFVSAQLRSIGGAEDKGWIDMAKNTRDQYDKEENAILHTSDRPPRMGTNPIQVIYEAFLSGNVGRTIDAGPFQLVHQGQQVVEEGGKRWIEHRFKLHEAEEVEVCQQESIVRVDPDTQLPFQSESVTRLIADPSKSETTRSEIDYPEHGPEDMYAFLGVPKTTKIIDRTVHFDVKQLAAAATDPKYWADTKFSALVVESQEDQPWWQGLPSRVWKNGLLRRVDSGMPPASDKAPPTDADPAQWWRQNAAKTTFTPESVCDGKWYWHGPKMNTPDQTKVVNGWQQQRHPVRRDGFIEPEPFCYMGHPASPNASAPYGIPVWSGFEITVNSKPTFGPPNTVLLEIRNPQWKPQEPDWAYPQFWRFWIDPARDYLVMRYDEVIARNGKDDITGGFIIEGVTQDPQGRWYPIVVRRRGIVYHTRCGDGILRFYYDFDAPIPDSLFDVTAVAADNPAVTGEKAKSAAARPAVRQAPRIDTAAAARQTQSTNQLKQINLAMMNFESTNKWFPPAYKADKNGKPLLSWRVLILPYMDLRGLYKQFHLEEPWDSEHNKTLIAKMPQVFKSPNGNAGDGMTNYLTVRGPKTIFSGSKGVGIHEVRDGTSITIATVEVDNDRAVIWTKPDDFAHDAAVPLKGLGGLRPNGFLAGFADGSVHFIKLTIDPATLNALFTCSGGELVDMNAVD